MKNLEQMNNKLNAFIEELDELDMVLQAGQKLIDKLDEPWSDPRNLEIIDEIISEFDVVEGYGESIRSGLNALRELVELEIADPHCSTCGLTDTVATEGGQGEERGCRCDPQADMIEYKGDE